ncbi:MAG: PAS domain S-box protein, partial [Actinomycetota bacterium]
MFMPDESFSIVFENSPIGMSIQDLDGNYLRVNAAYTRLLGRSEEQLLASNWRGLTHPDDHAAIHQWLKGARDDGDRSTQFHSRYLGSDGREISTLVSVSLLLEQDRPVAFFSQVKELERHSIEEQLLLASLHDPLT